MAITNNPIPSSSPAFATPLHPPHPRKTGPIPAPPALKPPILPILLPPATLRPQAFRTFTKKHNLTLNSSALGALAAFIGRHCGSGWREEGLAEGVLEEVAKQWKRCGGAVIVEDGKLLKEILKQIEGSIVGGRIVQARGGLSRQASLVTLGGDEEGNGRPNLLDRESSFGMSRLEVDDEEEVLKDPREWVKVVSAFEQPRLIYNSSKKHFEKSNTKPSLFPSISQQTQLFRNRYTLTQARILRNEHFQPSTLSTNSTTITPIANLLGRTGSQHLLLALLGHSPTGTLCLSDLTGSVSLDLQHARPIPSADAAWFTPGMLVLVEGSYEEDYTASSGLGGAGGVGGMINGKFVASSVAHPPCERRSETLGISEGLKTNGEAGINGPAFGWTDFLGVGSERATGARMRRLQSRILSSSSQYEHNSRIAIAGEVNLDNPSTLSGLRAMLNSYSTLEPTHYPMAIVLIGNFSTHATMSGTPSTNSIAYKENFNALAAVLSDFPQLIARTTLIFVPGDNDAWASSFSAGAAAPVPRAPVPEVFTTRIRRAVAEANREVGGAGKRKEGEVVWTSNPSRLTWFGAAGEMLIYRDDISSRLRRTAVKFARPPNPSNHPADGDEDGTYRMDDIEIPDVGPAVSESKRLTKTLLDQSHLSPFPLSTRPVHWAFGSALGLYPLPTALVVVDKETPAFVERYFGCVVMNPGRLVEGRKGDTVRWVEFDVKEGTGKVRGVEG